MQSINFAGKLVKKEVTAEELEVLNQILTVKDRDMDTGLQKAKKQ